MNNIFKENSEKWMSYILEYGVPFTKGILLLLIGFLIIKAFKRVIKKQLSKTDLDQTVQSFLLSLLHYILLTLLLLSVMSTIGVAMTSFIAIIGAAGLAIGLSLQGTLQNFASGVMILILRPFKVGDFIEGMGQTGVVKEIQLFTTIISTGDNKIITIPNGGLFNSVIINYSTESTRRVDMTFGIGYGDDLKKAKQILAELVDSDERILKEPAPVIMVAELADNSVNINVRPWVKSEDYWSVYGDITENVKLRFDLEGISIPFPQRDVHLYNRN